MKVTPTTAHEPSPQAVLKLFQDANGHWFVSVERLGTDGLSFFNTSTYDSPFEAIQDAVHRLNL